MLDEVEAAHIDVSNILIVTCDEDYSIGTPDATEDDRPKRAVV